MRTIFANLLVRKKALKMLLEDGLFTKFLPIKQRVSQLQVNHILAKSLNK